MDFSDYLEKASVEDQIRQFNLLDKFVKNCNGLSELTEEIRSFLDTRVAQITHDMDSVKSTEMAEIVKSDIKEFIKELNNKKSLLVEKQKENYQVIDQLNPTLKKVLLEENPNLYVDYNAASGSLDNVVIEATQWIVEVEKTEERIAAKGDKQVEHENTRPLKELDDMFVKADNFVHRVQNDPNYQKLDESSFREVITSLWSSIYKSALLSFISSVETNYSNKNITEEGYKKIKPLLLQWKEKLDNIERIDQQHFVDFQEDLKIFSEQHPEWLKAKTVFQSFNEDLWKPFFEKYCIRTETIAKQFEDFSQKITVTVSSSGSTAPEKVSTGLIMDRLSLDGLQALDPIEFENLVKTLLTKMNFRASTTKSSGDGGIDIIAMNEQPIVGGKYIIQCKRFKAGNNVGEPVIRDLYGVMHAENANKGILITTSEFTKQAVSFAQGKTIELITGTDLLSLIEKFLPDHEYPGSYVSETQVEQQVSAVKEFLEEFNVKIEREKIRTTKNRVELVEYIKLTNLGSFFRNEFTNIMDYYEGLLGELNRQHLDYYQILIETHGANVDPDAFTQPKIQEHFRSLLEHAIQDSQKRSFFTLVEDYCSKTYKLFRYIMAFTPPTVAENFHQSWVELLIQYLKVFTVLKEYLREWNATKKGLYNKIIMDCLDTIADKTIQHVKVVKDFYQKAEASLKGFRRVGG